MDTRPAHSRSPGRWDTFRQGGIGLLAGLVVGAIVSGVVYVNGQERVAAMSAEGAASAVQSEQALAAARDDLADARSYQALLRARIAAGAALEEIDRQNFGVSREQLRYVGVALAEVDPARVGVNPEQLAEAQALVERNLQELAPDAATQRDRLEGILRALDAFIPRDPQG